MRDWPSVRDEVTHGPHGTFFRSWIPEWISRTTTPSMEELFLLLDKVWDNNPPFDVEGFARYYKHPVWWLNAKMEELHRVSIEHRLLAVAMAQKHAPRKALDRGGGYGLLVRMAHAAMPETLLDVEDLVNAGVLAGHFKGLERVRVVSKPDAVYDVIWSIEVFEHLPDPIQEAYALNLLLRTGGVLITSYSFYPIIKCHLPQNFFLRHVFHRLLPFLGYRCDGCERPGITIWTFRKMHDCSRARLRMVKLVVLCLRPLFQVLNLCYLYLRRTRDVDAPAGLD